MTTTRSDYHVRAYELGDRPAVLALLQASLAGGPTGTRTADFFAWKHERNPFGTSTGLVAEADGEVIGFRTFLRWRFRLGDRTVTAARAVDTATHPDHQGRGIFTRLTRVALEELRSSTDLIFNTPNAQSLPGYLKMGWSVVGTVPIAFRPVRPLRFAAGLRSVTRGAPAGPPPACPFPAAADVLGDTIGVAQLLAEAGRSADRLTTDRSVEYLRWRYGDAVGLDYRAVPLHRGGELVGLGLGRPRRRGPLAEFTLSEVIVREGDAASARRVLRAAARGGSDHVATSLPPAVVPPSSLRRAGYLSWPGVGMTLTARPLTDAPSVHPTRLAAWSLSLGDVEVF